MHRQGRLNWGAGGAAAPFAFTYGVGGARIALYAELFPSLLPLEGAFSDVVDSFVQNKFSGSKPPDPQIPMILLGDKYSKQCSSGKELEAKNLPLLRSIHIYRCAFRGSLATLP